MPGLRLNPGTFPDCCQQNSNRSAGVSAMHASDVFSIIANTCNTRPTWFTSDCSPSQTCICFGLSSTLFCRPRVAKHDLNVTSKRNDLRILHGRARHLRDCMPLYCNVNIHPRFTHKLYHLASSELSRLALDKMRAPSSAALLVLAGLCLDQPYCFAQAQQDPLRDPNLKAKYREACPAYEHYAKFPQ